MMGITRRRRRIRGITLMRGRILTKRGIATSLYGQPGSNPDGTAPMKLEPPKFAVTLSSKPIEHHA
jgi:hypothetical protein